MRQSQRNSRGFVIVWVVLHRSSLASFPGEEKHLSADSDVGGFFVSVQTGSRHRNRNLTILVYQGYSNELAEKYG
jgi:hypothetical protein